MSRRGVVVTGLGAVSALGCGREALARALQEGTPHFGRIDLGAGYHRRSPVRAAALVNGADLSPWLAPMAARRMSPPSKLAVSAAKMALEDAGLDSGEIAADGSTAVYVSTAFGPSSFSERILQQILLESPEAVSPFLFTESVANAPAAQIALTCKALGPNVTVTQREAGPLIALARGAAEIAAGRVRRTLVAAVDELNPLLHSVLDRFGALSETPRPFDRRRDGFAAAEGATVLVLEEEGEAVRRGAVPLARLCCDARAFDPDASAFGWGRQPAALARALGRRLEASGVTLESIDAVVSGASGSRDGDRLEALVLRALWNGSSTGSRPLPPVLAPKGVTGEHGGGLLGAAALAACGEGLGPTAGFEEADAELGLIPHDGRPLAPPRRILVSSLAAGGAAAWAVLDRGEA